MIWPIPKNVNNWRYFFFYSIHTLQSRQSIILSQFCGNKGYLGLKWRLMPPPPGTPILPIWRLIEKLVQDSSILNSRYREEPGSNPLAKGSSMGILVYSDTSISCINNSKVMEGEEGGKDRKFFVTFWKEAR